MAAPTLDVQEGVTDSECSQQNQTQNTVWAELLPARPVFTSFGLEKDSYLFGRGEECDYVFSPEKNGEADPNYLAYSKNHFTLELTRATTGSHTFLTDLSSNGTFLNGTKLGKGVRNVIQHNDVIALAIKNNRAFVFMDRSEEHGENELPEELKQRYILSKVLGEGAFGEVRLGFERDTCRQFAVKIIKQNVRTLRGTHQINQSHQLQNEIDIMKKLKHPNVVSVEDVIESGDTVYLVLELVDGGELFDRVVSVKQLDEPTSKLYFYQMVLAVKYLHDQGITHRDLKPENILMATGDKETLVKIADFGLSKFVEEAVMLQTICGTPTYIAPEILQHQKYTKSVDCWSLGVILFICLGGYQPFADTEESPMFKKIINGSFSFNPRFWSNVSDDAKDMVSRLLTVNVAERIKIGECLDHPWLKDNSVIEKVEKLTKIDSGYQSSSAVVIAQDTNSAGYTPAKKKQKVALSD